MLSRAVKDIQRVLCCRICQSALTPFISFGAMPIANGFLNAHEIENESFYPLECAVCTSCWMMQLTHQPPPEKLFHSDYPFFTGSSQRMTSHFQILAENVTSDYLDRQQDPFILEIGSNDGTFLKHFSKKIRTLGVEPSANVAHRARTLGIPTRQDFFSRQLAEKILKEQGQPHVIYAANVFCHTPNLPDVFEGLKKLLHPEGVLIFEDPYLPSMFDKVSYDQIYDEHVFLFSLLSVQNLAKRHGLEVYDVQPLDTHGGSMRYFLSPGGRKQLYDDLWELTRTEKAFNLDQIETYKKFYQTCEKSRDSLKSLLLDLKQKGKSIAGYAATSKSTPVLNYAQIGTDLIDYIADSTPEKQGKVTPGTHIPIYSPEYFRTHYPDYTVLFGWNHLEEISAKEKEYLKSGGRWIVYVPKVSIL